MSLALVAQSTQEPFWDRILVAVAGPLIATVVGSGIVGWIILRLSERGQERRSERELRRELLAAVMKTGTALYLALQSFRRSTQDVALPVEVKMDLRRALDGQYAETRVQASFIEGELRALLGEPAATHWHKVDDLLTVRYIQLTDNASEKLYQINARGYEGKEHSGLSVAELVAPGMVLKTYHQALQAVAGEIMTAKFLERAGSSAQTQL
jgi:hypothetical protein